MFLGAYGYAEDVILLAPSREGSQRMPEICETFSSSHSMLFSSVPNPAESKTKCLFFSRKRKVSKFKKVMLNGYVLPWVESDKHLGSLLTSKIVFSCYSPETKVDLLVASTRGLFSNSLVSIPQLSMGQTYGISTRRNIKS